MEDKNKKKFSQDQKEIERYRKTQQARIAALSGFKSDYNWEIFMKDFITYFEADQDFNLEKIQEVIKDPLKLGHLVQRATKNNTHPVIEFVQDLFKDLGSSGNIPWGD